jgi:hypothetical protein
LFMERICEPGTMRITSRQAGQRTVPAGNVLEIYPAKQTTRPKGEHQG